MKKIPLTQGKYALVDDEDFEWLNQWKWCAHKYKGGWRAVRGTRKNGTQMFYMHRAITGLKKGDGQQVDHVDHNGLNNQRRNLRICSNTQNQQNRKVQRNNKAGLKGVSPCNNKWRGSIYVNGNRLHLGYFNTKKDAHEAYQQAAKKYFGEFACVV